MGTSCVSAMEEIVCKHWVSVCFGEEVGREVVSFLSEWGGLLEESKGG